MNMKYIAYTGALMAALCMASTGMAQEDLQPPPGAPDAPAAPGQPKFPADAAANYKKAQAEYADAQGQYQKVQAEAARAQADAASAQGAPSFNQRMATLMSTGNNAYVWDGPGGRGDSPLIIRSSETDAKTLAAEQEDLTIMGRILEKSLSGRDEDERPEAMGIKLITVGGPGGVRSMQIEGYGAIFMLNVNFPLVGPTNKADEGESKEPTNTTWDEAKREVYGQPGGADGNPFGARFSKEEFDPKRVEKLKDSLLDALKNASNMRNLKPDESVTVVVRSSAGRMGGPMRVQVRAKGGGSTGFTWNLGGMRFDGGGESGGAPNIPEPPPAMRGVSYAQGMGMGDGGGSAESVLTIRMKKLDIDTFAKGKATPDDFRRRATVLIY
jgi:hypothetical protein